MLLYGGRLESGTTSLGEFWTHIGDRGNGKERIDELAASGFLRKTPRRPPRFGAGLGLVLGVSLGKDSLRAGLVDANGIVHHLREAPAVRDRFKANTKRTVLADIGTLASKVLQDGLRNPVLAQVHRIGTAAKPALPLLGAAAAWPAPVHRVTKRPEGRGLHSDDWYSESLATALARVLHIDDDRAHALNDANSIALAAAFDESRRLPRILHEGQVAMAIRVGGGIGAGTAILDRFSPTRSAFLETKLIEGSHGFAGELGHLVISARDIDDLNADLPDGLAPIDQDSSCSCGTADRVHLEAVASAAALIRRWKASRELSGSEAEGSVGMSHEDARELAGTRLGSMALRDAGKLIGRCLAAPILMLNPLTITLAGAAAVDALASGIEDEKPRWRSAFGGPDPELRCLDAAESKRAALRGAALVVIRGDVFRRFDAYPRSFTEDDSRLLHVERDHVALIADGPRSPTGHRT
ncbi:MAG: ROK family protein [Thermoleophilaceae bacterium]